MAYVIYLVRMFIHFIIVSLNDYYQFTLDAFFAWYLKIFYIVHPPMRMFDDSDMKEIHHFTMTANSIFQGYWISYDMTNNSHT